MSTPLKDLWEAASTQPFEPVVPKSAQPVVGFSLLLTGMFEVIMPNIWNSNIYSIHTYLSVWS